ncbi:hypothetical protein CsatA_014925 [Cannabis sativa]
MKRMGDATDRETSFICSRCSPGRVVSIISQLSSEQKTLVNEIGFGNLLGLKKCNLKRKLIQWLVDNFNVEDGCLRVHGKVYEMNSHLFSYITGIHDGGEHLSDSKSDNCNDGRILISHLEEKLKCNNKTDMGFVHQFLLFIVSVFLMPNTTVYASRDYEAQILALKDLANVRRINWASMSFKYLVMGLSAFKRSSSKYVCGCLYFLQVFYLHHVRCSESFVDRSLCPIWWWSDCETNNMIEWIDKNGGLGSSTINMREILSAFDMDNVVRSLSHLCCRVENLEKVYLELQPNVLKEPSKDCLKFSRSEPYFTKREFGMDDQDYHCHYLRDFDPMIIESNIGSLVDNDNKDFVMDDIEKNEQKDKVNIVERLTQDKGDVVSSVLESNFSNMISLYKTSNGLRVGAFNLSHRLSEEEFSLALYMFDPILSGSEVLVENPQFVVQRIHFLSLRPHHHVHRKIIDAYSSFLYFIHLRKLRSSNTSNGIMFLPSFYPGQLTRKSFCEMVVKWCKCGEEESWKTLIVRMELVVVPLMDVVNNHVILVVVNLNKKFVTIWDSKDDLKLHLHKQELVLELLEVLDDLFLVEVWNCFGVGWKFSNSMIIPGPSLPQQTAVSDCGVFVIKYMKILSEGRNMCAEFDPLSERLAVSLELVAGDNNLVKFTVSKDATEHHQHQLRQGDISSKRQRRRSPEKLLPLSKFSSKKKRRRYWQSNFEMNYSPHFSNQLEVSAGSNEPTFGSSTWEQPHASDGMYVLQMAMNTMQAIHAQNALFVNEYHQMLIHNNSLHQRVTFLEQQHINNSLHQRVSYLEQQLEEQTKVYNYNISELCKRVYALEQAVASTSAGMTDMQVAVHTWMSMQAVASGSLAHPMGTMCNMMY